jgi:hypothetical protein
MHGNTLWAAGASSGGLGGGEQLIVSRAPALAPSGLISGIDGQTATLLQDGRSSTFDRPYDEPDFVDPTGRLTLGPNGMAKDK